MSEQRPFEVGDVVYEVGAFIITRTTVVHVTRTQAVTAEGGKYRRSDGRKVGPGGWGDAALRHPTDALDRRWREMRARFAQQNLEIATLRGTPAEVRAAFAVWDKLEKEVNGE